MAQKCMVAEEECFQVFLEIVNCDVTINLSDKENGAVHSGKFQAK